MSSIKLCCKGGPTGFKDELLKDVNAEGGGLLLNQRILNTVNLECQNVLLIIVQARLWKVLLDWICRNAMSRINVVT